ncbi:MAG: CCA tRNA nucleotidyltransferase, partial [Pseudomonadota bacterium]
MKRLNADWLKTPQTQVVIAALEAARPRCARFVGGCVRNAIMGREVDDIDIATQLEPEATLAALEAAGIRAIPTGVEHGTVTAIVDHVPFEITSLRRDVETDGRRAVVAFTEDWAEDAQRRDFRLNALYAAPDGEVFDPVGGGYEDALAGRVIFIGEADERLREDYLRILRFFRFNAWYGAGIDEEGLAACARQRDGLQQIAKERIWKEFKKLLAAPEPVAAVEAMMASGVLGHIL